MHPGGHFDPVAACFGNPGWRHHRADKALAGEVTVYLVYARTGLIYKMQPTAPADQLSNHLVQGRKGAVYPSRSF